MKILYSKIQELIDGKLPEPNELGTLINTHAFEVEEIVALANGDTLFDLAVLPDRAADCLSHYGIAREVSALLDMPLQSLPDITHVVSGDIPDVSVVVDPGSARRYMARRIMGVQVRPSPQWLQVFLESLGQRSINNIVDATNYVMWMYGQPCHAFDAKKIQDSRSNIKEGEPEITVRFAQTGEKMTTLDNREIQLLESDVVIANTDTVLALGGVKGGMDSGIDDTTTEVILEVANFYPKLVRKTARRLGLLTDAAKRFENDFSESYTDDWMNILTDIVIQVAGGSAGPVTDVYPGISVPVQYDISISAMNALLGTSYSAEQCIGRLVRKGFVVQSGHDADSMTVTIPAFRRDMDCWQALADEVVRYDGYAPGITWSMKGDQFSVLGPGRVYGITMAQLQNALACRLVDTGCYETLTYSFAESGDVRVAGSVAEDKSYLRSAIHPLFRESLDKNFRNRELMGVDVLHQFEIGTVWNTIQPSTAVPSQDKGPMTQSGEQVHICLGIHAQKQKGIKERLWSVLSDILYKCGLTEKMIHDCVVYHDDYIIECNLSAVVDSVTHIPSAPSSQSVNHDAPAFSAWSLYPYITRDIAVWVPNTFDALLLPEIYTEIAGQLLVRSPRLLDNFSKDDRTSYAYRLVFQSFEKTLTDDDIAPITDAIYSKLRDMGFEVR